MITDRFSGDISLSSTVDGGEINFIGGQPVMDQGGLENFVFISLFTAENWPGNAFEENEPANQIGSNFQSLIKGQAITPQLLRDIRESAEIATARLVDIGAAQEITVEVLAPDLNTIIIEILIVKSEEETITISYELNWQAGFNNPVNAIISGVR